jgi:hypothetical protein
MRVVLMCVRWASISPLTVFESIEAARSAAAVLPCGDRHCAGAHLIAWLTETGPHCEFVTEPARPAAAEPLTAARCWPTPTRENPPLTGVTRVRRR